MNNEQFFNRLREPCPVAVGKRIRLTRMPNDPDPIPVGSEGTVTGGNGGQMYVDWDCGRSLILIPGEDRWTVIA